MWELDYKEILVLKNWCFWKLMLSTLVLEKTLESPLDCKEIQPVNPKESQSWIFIGRSDAEAKLQYFGHLLQRLTHWKRPWCWERLKAGGEGVDRGWDGWYHWLDGYEFESASRAGDGQGSRACCNPWGSKIRTWLSNWTELNYYIDTILDD